MATLRVRSLARRYEDEVVALHDVSFTVEDGRIAAILGPSGCGKTTVLRLIAGLETPDAGDVLIDGTSVVREPPERRGIGLMFQDLALFPHLNVGENVEFGLRMAKWRQPDRLRRVDDLLRLVGLAGMERRRIDELSGGERQRVAIARTLAPQPAALLLDEPLGALDEERKAELRAQMRDLLERMQTTAVIVSHDLRDAIAIADDLVVMERGRVLQSGALPFVVAHPTSTSVARMLGYVTIVSGKVDAGRVIETGVGGVEIPSGLAITDRAEVLTHPAGLLAVPAGRSLGIGVTGVVMGARPEGPLFTLDVALGTRRTVPARWEWDLLPPPPGTSVELAARPETLRFFRLADDQAVQSATPSQMRQLERSARSIRPAALPKRLRAELHRPGTNGKRRLDDTPVDEDATTHEPDAPEAEATSPTAPPVDR